MSISQRVNVLLLGAMVFGITFSSASSRTWKATPTEVAADYAFISHEKSGTETVNIKWWAPPTLAPSPATEFLEKYVVISVVHHHLKDGISLSFDDIKTLQARDGSGNSLTFVPRGELPPAFIDFLSTLETDFRQTRGRIGDNTKFFVFEAGTARACEKGVISVRLAGETYTWETPFPGCPVPTDSPKRTRTVTIRSDVGANAPQRPPPASQNAVAQKAVLFEEDQSHPSGFQYAGSAVWHSEQLPPASGESPGLAVTAAVEIPDQRMGVQVSLHHNSDKRLSASHTIEIRFKLPADFPHGSISNIPGLLMKEGETTRGVPLNGVAAKVNSNFFLVALSAVEADMQRNIRLLKERNWIDIPIVYGDGKRAILAIEKGPQGERAFSDAFAAWNAPEPGAAQTNR